LNTFSGKKVLVIGGLAACAVGVFLVILFSYRCPSCGKFFALKEQKREVLSSGYVTKRVYENERWVRKTIKETKIRVTLKCKYCDHIKTRVETSHR